MKRLRPERPSGRPRFKERKVCLRCGRNMGRVLRRPYRKDWLCHSCGLRYGYESEVLVRVLGWPKVWWEVRGDTGSLPAGLLLVFEGEEV